MKPKILKKLLTVIYLLSAVFLFAQENIHTVYFKRNSSKVEALKTPAFNSYLNKINTLSIDSISIHGYSDYVGNKDHNLNLSEKRAQNVYNELKKITNLTLKNLLTNKTNAIGKGEIPALFLSPKGIPKDRKVNIIFHITPEKHTINNSEKTAYFKAEDGMKFNKTYVLGKVFFVGNKPDVIEASFAQLEDLYKQIKQLDSGYNLIIKGHICCLGEDASEDDKTFSRVLSTARALRVKEFLVNKGIDEQYIDYKGYSFDEPLVYPELTAEDRQKNRRIEVIIYK